MANATNAQVQQFVDSRIRPRAAQIRDLLAAINDDISAIGDVYATLNGANTWTDQPAGGATPPHYLSGSDVLAMNTLLNAVANAISTNPQYPICQKACLNPINATG